MDTAVRDDYTHETPATVTGAVACGVAPVPFLAVYTVVFLVHGSIKPVQPPDITSTKGGEFAAGWIALAVLLACTLSLTWFLNGRRRWPLAIVQLGVLGASIDFLLDKTKGGPVISALLVLAAAISLVLMFTPSAWWWFDKTAPGWIRRLSDLVLRRQSFPDDDPEADPRTTAADIKARRSYIGRRRPDQPVGAAPVSVTYSASAAVSDVAPPVATVAGPAGEEVAETEPAV